MTEPIGSGEALQPKRRPRRRRTRFKLTARFWVFLLILVVTYIGSAYAVGFIKIARLGAQVRAAQEQLKQIENENAALREHLKYMESDEYIETVARTELGLVMPGETAVVVITTDAEDDPIATERLAPNGTGAIPGY